MLEHRQEQHMQDANELGHRRDIASIGAQLDRNIKLDLDDLVVGEE